MTGMIKGRLEIYLLMKYKEIGRQQLYLRRKPIREDVMQYKKYWSAQMRQIKSFRLKAHNQLNACKFKADEKKFCVAQPETQTNEHCWDLHGSNIPGRIFTCHKGAGSLITNSGRGTAQQRFGRKPIASTATRTGFKGKIIPQIQCFLCRWWPRKDTEQGRGERGEVQQCWWSISDTFTVRSQPRILWNPGCPTTTC